MLGRRLPLLVLVAGTPAAAGKRRGKAAKWPDSVALTGALTGAECSTLLGDAATLEWFEADGGVIVNRNREVFDAEEDDAYGYRNNQL